MSKIPDKAMPVVRVLRRDVPRPKTMPVLHHESAALRFLEKGECPMGKHPLAECPTPACKMELPVKELSTSSIKAFWSWWDAQTDPQAAMDAVWPDK